MCYMEYGKLRGLFGMLYIYMYCSTALYNVLYNFEDVDALAKPYSIESVVEHCCKNGLETG